MAASAGIAHAELDVTVSAEGQVTVAGSQDDALYFGSANASQGLAEIPLSAWVVDDTSGVGNGTGDGVNGVGNGTGDSGTTNGVGNGTGDDAHGVGNGTGDAVGTFEHDDDTVDPRGVGNGTGGSTATVESDWGLAEVAVGCNEVSIIVYRKNADGEMVEADISSFATDYCQQ